MYFPSVGFTKASTELHPNFLIGLFLRDIFQSFDELAYKHGLEKIKTIGDAYMVVGGLVHNGEKLSSHSTSQSAGYRDQKPHATNIMLFAVDCFVALRAVNGKYNLAFELRVGIHTGPVVAGVLGLKRFAYDVWGDTVNVNTVMYYIYYIGVFSFFDGGRPFPDPIFYRAHPSL